MNKNSLLFNLFFSGAAGSGALNNKIFFSGAFAGGTIKNKNSLLFIFPAGAAGAGAKNYIFIK